MPKRKQTPPDANPKPLPPEVRVLQPGDVFDPESMLAENYDGPSFVANFDPVADATVELTFRTQQKGDVDPDSPAAKCFRVKYWAVERHHRFKDADGERAVGVTLSLFDVENHALVVTSDVVLRFWGLVLKLRGVGPWEDGLPICLEKVKTGQGRTMIQLRITTLY